MLPWNPPSAFSLTGDQQQRYGYPDASGSQQPPPSHQGPSQQHQQQQQQSPTGQQQQQQSPQQSPGAIPPPPTNQTAYPPMTLAATLHFLQSEHRRYARDRNEWEIERAEMRARIALLEGEKRGNEAALKSLGRRCKMLEMALRGERSKFLSTTNALGGTPSVSGTASPVPGGTPVFGKDLQAGGTAAIPPTKLAALQKDAPASASAPATPAEAPKSAPMTTSTSTPGQATAAPAQSTTPAHARGESLAVPTPAPNGTGTWSSAAAAASAAARDPRGKARSREYLKQCLQEITYLTSSATLNPLAAHSYAAPSVPRPRKVLPEMVPSGTAAAGAGAVPGMIHLAQPPPQAAEVPPPAGAAADPAFAPAVPSDSGSKSSAATRGPGHAHSELLTSFPSDPPSAFVPLRRQISHPGQQQQAQQMRTERDDARLDAEIALLASAQAPEANEDKPDDATAAIAIEAGATSGAGPLPPPRPLVEADEDEAAAEPVPQPESVKLGAAELALQAMHAAPEANEEKPDDEVALIATAGEEGEVEGQEESAVPISEEGEALPEAKDAMEEGEVDEPDLFRADPASSTLARGPGGGSRVASSSGTLSRGRGQRSGLAAVLASPSPSPSASAFEGLSADTEDAPTAFFGGAAGGEEWRAKLREAGRRAYPGFAGREGARIAEGGGGGGDKELQELEWDLEDATAEDEPEAGGGRAGGKKRVGKKGPGRGGEDTVALGDAERFKPRRVLRSHLDAVRVVACAEVGGQQLVATGGDDCVVKLWRDAFGKSSSRSDLEPVMTFRGHTGPITALAVSRPSSEASDAPFLFSASLDSIIRIWSLPSAEHDTYDPVDASLSHGLVEPRADAVWGLAALSRDRLACITADGSIQVWNWKESKRLASWTYGAVDGTGSLRKRPAQVPTPTALALFEAQLDLDAVVKEYLVVAFQNAVVKVFDPEDGREVLRVDADETADGTAETQINAIAVHPASSLIATAHEDRFIRVFDARTGEKLVSHLAHLDGVTSLAFSPLPSPSSGDIVLASTSHDTSLRLWTLHLPTSGAKPSLTCVQEASTHRVKGAEGVLGVAFARDGTALVTAGADGTARVWEQ